MKKTNLLFQKLMEDLELRGLVKVKGELVDSTELKNKFIEFLKKDLKKFKKIWKVILYKMKLDGVLDELKVGDRVLLFLLYSHVYILAKMSMNYLADKELDVYFEHPLASGCVLGFLVGVLNDKEDEIYVKCSCRDGVPIFVHVSFLAFLLAERLI